MSRFKSFVNVIRDAVLKASDSLIGKNTDLPDKYFEEKTIKVKDISNEPFVNQKVVKKQKTLLELTIADEDVIEKQEAILDPVPIIDYTILINKESIIPCPICHTPIPFNAQNLLAGVLFSCSSCSASVGLSHQSRPIVEKTINKLEELKINK